MNEYIDSSDYSEFLKWKQQRDDEAAERLRKQRLKQKEREINEDFIMSQKLDKVLMDGVSRGLTWSEYLRETGAPGTVKDRYIQLQRESGIVPGAKDDKPDLFLKGFEGAGY